MLLLLLFLPHYFHTIFISTYVLLLLLLFDSLHLKSWRYKNSTFHCIRHVNCYEEYERKIKRLFSGCMDPLYSLDPNYIVFFFFFHFLVTFD